MASVTLVLLALAAFAPSVSQAQDLAPDRTQDRAQEDLLRTRYRALAIGMVASASR